MEIKKNFDSIINYLDVGIYNNTLATINFCAYIYLDKFEGLKFPNLLLIGGLCATFGVLDFVNYRILKNKIEEDGWEIATKNYSPMFPWGKHILKIAAEKTGNLEKFLERK